MHIKRVVTCTFVVIFLIIKGNASAAVSDSLFTDEELRWLEKNKNNIRFAPVPAWAPADYIDEEGNHQGIVSDYIEIFEKELGVEFIQVNYTNWSKILEELNRGTVDFVGSIQQTDERMEYLSFTDTYMQLPNVILVQNNYPATINEKHISRMHLAGVRDYANTEYVKTTFSAEFTEVDDDFEALMQTSLGHTDGTVIDLMSASYLIEKYGINNLSIGKELDYSWDIKMATNKPILTSILNKLLSQINSEERAAIYNKWVNINNIDARNALERNYQRLFYFLILAAALVIIFFVYNYQLKKQIKLHTRNLQKEIEQKEEREKELQVALKEREILLAEIHHRVKNNLAVISGLLQLEGMSIENEQANQIIHHCLMRIKSMAVIHDYLYDTKDFSNIPFHLSAKKILEPIPFKHKNFQINFNIDEVYLNINHAVPAALLLNELVSLLIENSNSTQSSLMIKIFRNESLVVMSFEKDKVSEESVSIKNFDNYILINALEKQLKGDVQVNTSSNKFTYKISFPDDVQHGSSGNPVNA